MGGLEKLPPCSNKYFENSEERQEPNKKMFEDTQELQAELVNDL